MLRPYLEHIAGTADRFVFMDCEMTGFGHEHNDLIEVGIIQMDFDGEVIDVWESLIRSPDGSAGDEATQKIHNITPEMLADAASFDDLSGDIAQRLDGACLVGYGLRHDIAFLKSAPTDSFVLRERKFIDVGRACQMKMDRACKVYNVRVTNPHTAVGDAAATAVLFFRALDYWIRRGKRYNGCVATSATPAGRSELWKPRGGYNPASDISAARDISARMVAARHPQGADAVSMR